MSGFRRTNVDGFHGARRGFWMVGVHRLKVGEFGPSGLTAEWDAHCSRLPACDGWTRFGVAASCGGECEEDYQDDGEPEDEPEKDRPEMNSHLWD